MATTRKRGMSKWGADIRGTWSHAGVRDSGRSKCYNWEFRNLRGQPNDGDFADKGAAKGFARLCRNVGLRRLETRLVEVYGWDAPRASAYVERKRTEYRAHFTKDHTSQCHAGTNGVYFAAWGWTKVIIAHEIAHFVEIAEGEAVKAKRSGHGADWLGWFFFLLVDACGFDLNYLRGTALVGRTVTPLAK